MAKNLEDKIQEVGTIGGLARKLFSKSEDKVRYRITFPLLFAIPLGYSGHSPIYYPGDPYLFMESGVVGTTRTIEQISEEGVRGYVNLHDFKPANKITTFEKRMPLLIRSRIGFTTSHRSYCRNQNYTSSCPNSELIISEDCLVLKRLLQHISKDLRSFEKLFYGFPDSTIHLFDAGGRLVKTAVHYRVRLLKECLEEHLALQKQIELRT